MFYSFRAGTKNHEDRTGLKRGLREIIEREHGVFYEPANVKELQDGIREAIDEGHTKLGMAGGDGSFMLFYNSLLKVAPRRDGIRIFPLKCGTGNGISYSTGFGDPKQALEEIVREETVTRSLPLISVTFEDGHVERTHIWSIGYDAKILSTYVSQKVKGLFGYILATAKVLPEMLQGRKYQNFGRITTGDSTLYEGPFNMIMAGTTPHYGYNLKVLPLAGMDGQAHVRMCSLGPISIVPHLYGLLTGSFVNRLPSKNPKLIDWLADTVRVEVDTPAFSQSGGELRGLHRNLLLNVEDAIDVIYKR